MLYSPHLKLYSIENMMQTVQELPPNLPIQTQLYLIERIAGAVVSVISYTLLAALGVIYMQLNFLLMLMVITGVSFNWIYRASRQAESGRISPHHQSDRILMWLQYQSQK